MKLLVVGGGGREHAVIRKLKENPAVTEIFALPGNGGIAADATCVPIGAKDIEGIVRFARENAIDYAADRAGLSFVRSQLMRLLPETALRCVALSVSNSASIAAFRRSTASSMSAPSR